jgi:hypothetical protein
VSCIPGEACWIRAGEPLVLHWMSDDQVDDVVRRAACGVTSVAWRRVDGDEVTATACRACAAVVLPG